MEKRGQFEHLHPWIIIIGLIFFSLILFMMTTGKASGAIEFLHKIIRGGK